MLASAAGTGGSEGAAPIYLTAEPVEGGMRVQVIGAAAADVEASFLLEVSSPSGRSQHRGSASLHAGDRATLSTVTVGVPANGAWQARLRVEPVGRDPYEQVAASPSR